MIFLKRASFFILALVFFNLRTESSTYVSAASVEAAVKSKTVSETAKEEPPSTLSAASEATTNQDLATLCYQRLSGLPGPFDKKALQQACSLVKQKDGCTSVHSVPIFHYERAGTDLKRGKKILALALIHGDELPSGSVARAWMSRLESIDARNTWRVLPLINPDGLKARTRYNANKVDINRNFPSKDWEEHAIAYWERSTKKDKRRYPGPTAASEPETRCLVQHIEEFKPDFIISVHTPLGVLDFDGPKQVGNPGFKPLPWVGLGNYAGSLGRYMWVDNKTPVLTIELRGNSGIRHLEEFDRLQDISGTVAIQAGKILEQNKTAQKK